MQNLRRRRRWAGCPIWPRHHQRARSPRDQSRRWGRRTRSRARSFRATFAVQNPPLRRITAPADGTTAALEQQPAAMGHPELDAPQATVEAAEQQSAEALDGKPGESLAPPKKRGGRPQSPARFFARDIAFKWLDENGTSQPGDGEQAKLERHITDKLAKRNEFPAESTIRDWVGNFIAEYEAGRRI